MTRQAKTPAQRAQEQYDVACRIAARLLDKVLTASGELEQLKADLDAAQVRRDYLAHHPDLPPQPTTPTGDNPS